MDSEITKTGINPNLFSAEGFAVGKSLNGKYVIEKQLGMGGMGLTYLACDADNIHRKVVIKTILQRLSSAEGKAAFLKEGEALGRIRHDGVVQLYDKGEDAETGLPFLVMEYVKGATLTKIIDRGQLDLKKAVEITRKIAFALTAAHKEGVFHRDLKPDNILVIESDIEEDKVKLIDFGVAKVANSVVGIDSTYLGSFKGTLQYASPEQLGGFQTIEGETFNVANLTYEMLTEVRPFQITVEAREFESGDSLTGRAFMQVKELQQNGAKNPQIYNPQIPDSMIKVLLKGLEYDAFKRYQTPLEFAEALKISINEEKLPITVPFVPEIPVSPKPRSLFRRLLLPLAAILVLAAVGLLGLAGWRLLNQNTAPETVAKPSPTPQILTSATPIMPETVFAYSFEVQKMKDNLPVGKPFETADKSRISSGDKFNLKIIREKAGAFYLVEQTDDSLKVVFPTADKDAKNISTWRVAKENQVFWLVWSKTKIEMLETNQPNSTEVKQFLDKNKTTLDSKEVSGKINILTKNDLAIHQLPF